eukprot:601489-Hanusia_phi.AAC.1
MQKCAWEGTDNTAPPSSPTYPSFMFHTAPPSSPTYPSLMFLSSCSPCSHAPPLVQDSASLEEEDRASAVSSRGRSKGSPLLPPASAAIEVGVLALEQLTVLTSSKSFRMGLPSRRGEASVLGCLSDPVCLDEVVRRRCCRSPHSSGQKLAEEIAQGVARQAGQRQTGETFQTPSCPLLLLDSSPQLRRVFARSSAMWKERIMFESNDTSICFALLHSVLSYSFPLPPSPSLSSLSP